MVLWKGSQYLAPEDYGYGECSSPAPALQSNEDYGSDIDLERIWNRDQRRWQRPGGAGHGDRRDRRSAPTKAKAISYSTADAGEGACAVAVARGHGRSRYTTSVT